MFQVTHDRCRISMRAVPATAALALCVLLLAGCGSSETAGQWGKGVADWVRDTPPRPAIDSGMSSSEDDFPKIPDDRRPFVKSAKERKDLTQGLASDRDSGQGTASAVLAAPATEPLRHPDDMPSAATVAALSADPSLLPPPPPALALPATPVPAALPPVTVVPIKPPPVEPPQPKSVSTPAAVVAEPTVPAPPRLAVPSTVPAPSVDEIYRKRLAEFDAGRPAQPAAPPAEQGAASGEVALASPEEYRKRATQHGVRPLEAFDTSTVAASFQMAPVRFGEGTMAFAAGQTDSLNEVARLAIEKHGRVRIVGHSASPRLEVEAKSNREANRVLAKRRAEAVAEFLIRLGVPARSLYAGAAPDQGGAAIDSSADVAEIYIDY